MAEEALENEGPDFRVALAGKNYRQTAPEFEVARERLGTRVVHFGYADEAQYAALLRQADVVVSTVLHEFFGIAVVEAVYCGCFPVLPRRLTYPELVPLPHHEACLYEDFEGLLARLRWALAHPDRARALAAELRPAAARFDWVEMGPRYDEVLAASAKREARGKYPSIVRSTGVLETRRGRNPGRCAADLSFACLANG